ncbi:MAG: FAD-dependent thymidylate synthase [Christensenellales bacterium]
MPETQLHVELLSCTPEGDNLVALAAKLCYAKSDVSNLREKISKADQSAFIEKIMSSGHLSVVEHVSMTFVVEGVSRVLLAQLTRHRIASFSVQSQRYVSLAEQFNYIIPPRIKALGEAAEAEYKNQMTTMHEWYKGWQSKLGMGESSNEDARFVLPNACETRLVMTMNVRELKHFFRLRCCERAQWEIRAMATEMLRIAKQEFPALFADDGPGCVSGPCPEGRMTCGRMNEIREKFKQL